MRGSVGNSGNQGGKRLGAFRLGVFRHISLLFRQATLFCAKEHKYIPSNFVKNVRRATPGNSVYS